MTPWYQGRMQRPCRFGVVLVLLAGAACRSDKAEPREIGAARAVTATATAESGAPGTLTVAEVGHGAAESLRYSIDAFPGSWKIAARFKTRPGSKNVMDLSAAISLRFARGTGAALQLFLEELVLKGDAGGTQIDQRMAPGDPARAAAFTSPLNDLTLAPTGPVRGVPNPENPLAAQGSNLIDTAVFLMPPLPDAAVGVGARWSATRVVPKSSAAGPEITADVHFELTALESCGAPLEGRCAAIRCTADTGPRTMKVEGEDVTVRYTLDGQTRIQLGGAIVRSAGKMTMISTIGGEPLELDGDVTFERI
jgi:hypothetical protein